MKNNRNILGIYVCLKKIGILVTLSRVKGLSEPQDSHKKRSQ